ncbi:MAG: sigma-54-dependent Fis family transcriptional regulator [Acidobacteria bacterium]|nr:MAG: Fis family transcriptional regulator [Acidobacteria bacterium 13_2_20CM_58_27]PYT87977.1 MAG: sigma-54-dependent Fis family transcriptional regulator [Acidobacteriota bacterium]
MPRKAHLLVVDDDPNTLASLSRAFRLAGHEATVCDNASRAVELLRAENFDLILSDVVMPGKSGMELLDELKKAGVKTPVVLISGQANIEMAVKATRLGALDFLEKPLSTDKLLVTVENALRLTRLEDENRELRQRLGKHELVGSSPAMKKLLAQIARVAASETRVCILGETGTGKELVARAIHEKSPRRAHPFITLNCAAVPAELIESELFGHEKGSFTGAASRHLGKFEQAEAGTLFLDEIGDMPLAMQAKLLRVLEESEVERVGGDKPIKVNVRVLVATHRHLEELVKQNAFRSDLFHRVYVFPLAVAPLRERPEDFPELVAHFARQLAAQNGWKEKGFTPEAIAELRTYAWPGNLRELRNVVERLVLLASEPTIGAADVRLALPSAASRTGGGSLRAATGAGTLAERTEAFEREVLLAEIRTHNFHMTNVARALGLERSHLYKKCQQLGIDLQTLRKPD